MKKLGLFFVTLLLCTFFGCHKKPAQQGGSAQTDTVPAEVVAVEPVSSQLEKDITGLTPAGEKLSLSDLIGKTDYVLLDFWASWCGPCRRFVPVLKEIYRSQPEGHIQILSCSVDQDANAWRTALREEQMPWPQIREDEQHPCSDLYNVQFIPHTVLFDRDGRIVGVNLEEPDLEAVLLGD